ncbi:hypothetical protein [Mucisphaera calidilacus]|uniref:Uncharacterized protein n=1 Tax=Mucisphaera calidilacus TaxID=2527982 RepID=A0A518BTZ0_9BACT|nr:hypothetical protein [Mucisphaera calidilacus]QDU70440.1 hypothetical protein Pan265_02670 [Mucisphaera calidilacus]
MFQAILDAILDAWEQLKEFTLTLLEEYIPIDFENLDLVSMFTFVSQYWGIWNQVLPLNECLALLAAGLTAKYAIRAARWLITFIPAIGGG